MRRHDWQVWIAPDSIQLGEDWVQAINRGLAESGIFLLVLTPNAVNSRWVTSETNVAISLQHRNEILFIPLDVKATAAPPLWVGPQNVPFQSDYKGGLERLLQRLQPEKMAQVDGLYRQIQAANGRRQWPLVQQLGAQIVALYPDYRETEAQMALAQQAEAREKRQATEAAAQYDRLQAAMAAVDWATAMALANEIESLVPGYRDVSQLAARARQGQRQNRRETRRQWLRQIPVWGWVAAAVVFGSLLLGGVWAMMPDGTGGNESTATATSARIAVGETDTPTPGIGSTRIRPADEAVMVYVPAGEFMMGSEAGQSDEKPVHAVYLDSFWIDQTEVTNGMYALCVRDGDYVQPSSLTSYTRDSYYANPTFAEYPVINVSWQDARNYCEWAGARLPTQTEWEKAARWDEENQEARTYPWGNTFDGALLNFCDENCPFNHPDVTVDDGYEDTAPVGSYPDSISPYGALDMVGNVWEWTASLYETYPYDPNDGRENLNGTGQRVLRGGSWNNNDNNVRAANRNNNDPTNRNNNVGFRCAQ
ncbi:MAG: SUMF1/EgtB/PvdO family nonheme iron enzyme [Chloroflexi bacterium]|nr:SUMF1/EgtB/PvdO family nonheme iron enzyme [Ardenticatenaceae bacterium]MBL1130104.1 TIR domain-containing protein [Chloroflexota bacterium]NOG36191.1 SUMF1/EgtB/PvdO family nonheme iron enzyme [Chloroflexota bacterium]GIK56245.1 MAG: hypothetical protein BroJett015_19080 [Chloroflexota bacterium]